MIAKHHFAVFFHANPVFLFDFYTYLKYNTTCALKKALYETLAQSAEHLPFKQGVRSSNLRCLTKKALERE